MADEQRRRLQRRAAAGDPQAEARLLLAQVRAGELSRGRLALAAFLGHAPARAAAPEAVVAPALADDQQVAKHLARHGRSALTRALLAAGQRIVEDSAASADPPPDAALRSARAALRAVEDGLLCPCADHRHRAAALGEAVSVGTLRFMPLLRARDAARALAARSLREAQHEVARLALSRAGVQRDACELLPWVLGRGDPVRLRVANRGELTDSLGSRRGRA